MKNLILGLVIACLVSVGLFAQQASNIYMPLVQSNTFTSRVQYIIAMEAPVILTEAGTGTYTAVCHTARAKLAAQIVVGPASFAPVFAVFLATNVNVTTAGPLTGAGLTLDTPATDAALLAAVASLWSTVAGYNCATNP